MHAGRGLFKFASRPRTFFNSSMDFRHGQGTCERVRLGVAFVVTCATALALAGAKSNLLQLSPWSAVLRQPSASLPSRFRLLRPHAKVRLPMIVRTKGNDVGHAIFALVGQRDRCPRDQRSWQIREGGVSWLKVLRGGKTSKSRVEAGLFLALVQQMCPSCSHRRGR